MTCSGSNPTISPSVPNLRPGLDVARRVLLDVHATHGGMELALLALDVTIEAVDRRDSIHREVSARPLPGVRS